MIRHLVAFDRPLIAVSVPGQASKMYSETDVAAIRARAYEEGSDAARSFASQQLVEFRAEVQALQEGLFEKLCAAETDLFGQLRDTLPALAVDLARRLLAGYEPSAEQVQRVCEETLAQLYPEREGLELCLAPHDVALLEDISPAWKNRFPGLKITADASLASGDCQVRSRFGLTDARRDAKLQALSRELRSA